MRFNFDADSNLRIQFSDFKEKDEVGQQQYKTITLTSPNNVWRPE